MIMLVKVASSYEPGDERTIASQDRHGDRGYLDRVLTMHVPRTGYSMSDLPVRSQWSSRLVQQIEG